VSLSAKNVAEILRLLEESRFDELTLEMNGVKVQLRRGQGGGKGAGVGEGAPRPAIQPRSNAEPVAAAAAPAFKAAPAAPPGATAVLRRCWASTIARRSRASRRSSGGQPVTPDSIIGIIG
jgi:hypothetical protein